MAAISIQDLVSLGLELVMGLLRGIKMIGETIIPSISAENLRDLILSISSVIPWVFNILESVLDITANSDFDVVNNTTSGVTPGDPGTAASAFDGMLNTIGNRTPDIVGTQNGTSGVTYVINGTVDVVSNTSSDLGPRFASELYNFLAWVVQLVGDFLYKLPEIF